jgi:hypothetical protein
VNEFIVCLPIFYDGFRDILILTKEDFEKNYSALKPPNEKKCENLGQSCECKQKHKDSAFIPDQSNWRED